MTTHAPSPALPAEPCTDLPETFLDQVRASNPFIDNRVNSPSAADVDVLDIHRQAFERLTALAGAARDQRRGIGVLLWGEAGIGKSHLLSRLVRWAERDQQACAVYLHNLQASPENLPRSLLKAVVRILTRGQVRGFRQSPLFALVFAAVKEALDFDLTTLHPWAKVERAYHRLVDGLSAAEPSRAALVDRTAYDVLFRFFHSAFRAYKTHDERVAALAVRWLAGDYLDPDEAKTLGLPPGPRDEPVALADNQQIKQVHTALTRLALSRKQPFLLCFDQVDNLEENQAAALSRFLEALIDSSPNLLVVTAGIKATLLGWRNHKVIQDSAWDRLAQFEVSLQRLTPEESRRIIAARLEQFIEPFAEQEPVRQRFQQDGLFPLGRSWADGFFQDKIELRPRDAINGAREGWRRRQEALQQPGDAAWLEDRGEPPTNGVAPPAAPTEEQIREAIDRKVAQKIAEHCEQRRRAPDALPPDADNLAGLIAALLKQAAAGGDPAGQLHIDQPPSGKPDRQFPYSLIVRRQPGTNGQAVRTGLLFLATDGAFSTTANLNWLLRDTHHPERTLLVTEERLPVAFGAQSDAKGRQYYAELCQGKHGPFQHLVLTFEQYAHLDALRAVAGMARSGDLEIEWPGGATRPVSEQEVLESHHRQGRYQAAALLPDLLPEAPKESS